MRWRALPDDSLLARPYWGYEDIGAFLLLSAVLSPGLRLLVRFHLLSQSTVANPSLGLQASVVGFLAAGLYLVLKLRHHLPVLKPLGWVVPPSFDILTALILGSACALGITTYLRLRSHTTLPTPTAELLVLGVVLGPALEESLFRGCFLPLIAQTTGTVPAVLVTAVLFALFHGPSGLAHGMWLTAMGSAYGWVRVRSRSTTAAALMHAAYNFGLCLFAPS